MAIRQQIIEWRDYSAERPPTSKAVYLLARDRTNEREYIITGYYAADYASWVMFGTNHDHTGVGRWPIYEADIELLAWAHI